MYRLALEGLILLQLCVFMCAFERPQYHVVPPLGHWMNDPNGPFYDSTTGLYHLFYQYNPYGYVWGNMSWAHVCSQDLIHWKTLPVALYPDEPYDELGVFSGSIVLPGKSKTPVLYYTCVDGENKQRQCQADPHRETGGQNQYESWRKASDNPIITHPPGENPNYDQFRDPAMYVEMEGNEEIEQEIMIVAYQKDEETGAVAKYLLSKEEEGKGRHWVYSSDLWTTSDSSNQDIASESMVECPDFFAQQNGIGKGSTYVLKYSLMNTRRDYYEMGAYVEGKFRPDGGNNKCRQIDYGVEFAYYASKTFWDDSSSQGRRLQWGWASETDDNIQGQRDWAGVMALPRVVTYDEEGGFLRFSMVPEVESLHESLLYSGEHTLNLLPDHGDGDTLSVVSLPVNSSQAHVRVQLDITAIMTSQGRGHVDLGVSICGCGDNRTLLGYHIEPSDSLVASYIDTTHSGGTTPSTRQVNELPIDQLTAKRREDLYKALTLNIYIDHSMIEIFSAEGMHASTLRVYSPHSECQALDLFMIEGGAEAVAVTEEQIQISAIVDVYGMKSVAP